jgi:hypothetical protein
MKKIKLTFVSPSVDEQQVHITLHISSVKFSFTLSILKRQACCMLLFVFLALQPIVVEISLPGSGL